MADAITKILCKDCRGTGYRRGGNPPQPTDECGDCSGTGYVNRGKIALDIEALFSDVLDKCNAIKEKVDEIKTVVDAL